MYLIFEGLLRAERLPRPHGIQEPNIHASLHARVSADARDPGDTVRFRLSLSAPPVSPPLSLAHVILFWKLL